MGRWGYFMKASTHVSSVGVDLAAVECDCAAHYEDATSALPNKGSTSVKASTPSGRWKVKVRFKGRALTSVAVLEYTEQLVIVTVPPLMRSPPPCTHRSTTGHSIGAMEGVMVAFEGQRAHTSCPPSVSSVIEA